MAIILARPPPGPRRPPTCYLPGRSFEAVYFKVEAGCVGPFLSVRSCLGPPSAHISDPLQPQLTCPGTSGVTELRNSMPSSFLP